jgi:hypothetical protein
VTTSFESLPTDLAGVHAMILAQRDLLVEARTIASQAERERTSFRLEIERLKLDTSKNPHLNKCWAQGS